LNLKVYKYLKLQPVFYGIWKMGSNPEPGAGLFKTRMVLSANKGGFL
jgi:hypothetical protein